MITLRYTLEAVDPLLLTRLEGDPNSSVSFPYVPGSMVRGALIASYLRGRKMDLPGQPEARHLFFDGSVRYLPAYPVDSDGMRSLPAPLSWFHEKKEPLHPGATIHDLAMGEGASLRLPKSVGEQFCRWSGTRVELVKPVWQINVHTARDRVKGRATEDEGAVFRYQALAAGTRLSGLVLLADRGDADAVEELFAADLWLGRSGSAGYGRARILESVWEENGPGETGEQPSDMAEGDRLVVTLLSDTILRGGDGTFLDTLPPHVLPPAIGGSVKPDGEFKRVVAVGGFNTKWGLPLCQAHALQAGSVFRFAVKAPIAAYDLQRLQDEGVGERRVEGFGRAGVSWHTGTAPLTVVPPVDVARDEEEEPTPPPPIILTEDSSRLARQMSERLLRRDLDRRLAQMVHGPGCRVFMPPKRAQLSRLRAIALDALPAGDVGRLIAFLSDDNLKSHARDEYDTARIGEEHTRLRAWLTARLKAPETVWQELQIKEVGGPEFGQVHAEGTPALAQEYTIRLVEGVLHRATKEQGDD